MNMTLSADHRVLDGAVAAAFLADLVDALEHPNLLLW
jgi:pyruvate/2-oxoglutarate dehydrogenase complex dihydrolipoamide acyltransferase (E2) component